LETVIFQSKRLVFDAFLSKTQNSRVFWQTLFIAQDYFAFNSEKTQHNENSNSLHRKQLPQPDGPWLYAIF
jgi:hypothetical protein